MSSQLGLRRSVEASPAGHKPRWRPALAVGLAAAVALAWPTDYPPRRLVYPIARPEAARIARAFLQELGVETDGGHVVTWPVAGFNRTLDPPAPAEANLPPFRDDLLASRYVVEFGGLSAWNRLADHELPSAGWMTRSTTAAGAEWFVQVDPRRRQVVAFAASEPPVDPLAGARSVRADTDSLTPAAATETAHELTARLGLTGAWMLEHYDPPRAPAPGRPPRAVVRLVKPEAKVGAALPVLTVTLKPDGSPVGAGTTLRIPAEYAARRLETTALSNLLVVIRIGLLAVLGTLGVREIARRLRDRGDDRRRIARWALGVSVPILLYHLNRAPALMAHHPSHIPWSVFLAGSVVGLIVSALLQALLFGLALAGLAAARVDWLDALRPRRWRETAAAALATAILALAWGVIVDRLELLGRLRWPALFPGPAPPVLPGYGAIYPFFDVVWTTVTGSILIGGLISMLWLLTRGPFHSRRSRAVILTLVALGLGPDRALNFAEAVVPTLYEVLALGTAIFLARRLARGTLAAYLAALPLALGGQPALWLAQQPEPQIRLSGVLAFALLAAPGSLLAIQALRGGPKT